MYHDVYQKSESELGDPTRGISLITGYQGIKGYIWYTCTFMFIPRFIWHINMILTAYRSTYRKHGYNTESALLKGNQKAAKWSNETKYSKLKEHLKYNKPG